MLSDDKGGLSKKIVERNTFILIEEGEKRPRLDAGEPMGYGKNIIRTNGHPSFA